MQFFGSWSVAKTILFNLKRDIVIYRLLILLLLSTKA